MVDGWLKCFVYNGMFSDEMAVKVMQLSGERAFFVSKQDVQGEADKEGRVRVRTFWQGNILWAVLPTENQTTIPVNDADLVNA